MRLDIKNKIKIGMVLFFAFATVHSGVTAVACGYEHSMALKSDNIIVIWGAGTVAGAAVWPDYGQSAVPAGLSNVEKISAGAYHSMVLKSDGTVVTWGLNNKRQCIVPAGLNNVQEIAAGYYHSTALKNDGSVVVCGWPDIRYTYRKRNIYHYNKSL